MTEEDIRAVARALVERAKTGDVAAVREVFDRTIGKPQETDLLDRIETLEAAMAQDETGGKRR
jgi:hypothetical protein